jgi:hypothetical protein
MCAGLRKPCRDSSRHPGHGIPRLTNTCKVWASPRVRRILTCTSYLLELRTDPLISVLDVDDLFLTGAEELIARCKADLAIEFEMKDIGLMHYFLELEVWHRSSEIFLGQGKHTMEILRRFRMEDSRLMATPMVTNLKKVVASNLDL